MVPAVTTRIGRKASGTSGVSTKKASREIQESSPKIKNRAILPNKGPLLAKGRYRQTTLILRLVFNILAIRLETPLELALESLTPRDRERPG
jgi:hypothetical protein